MARSDIAEYAVTIKQGRSDVFLSLVWGPHIEKLQNFFPLSVSMNPYATHAGEEVVQVCNIRNVSAPGQHLPSHFKRFPSSFISLFDQVFNLFKVWIKNVPLYCGTSHSRGSFLALIFNLCKVWINNIPLCCGSAAVWQAWMRHKKSSNRLWCMQNFRWFWHSSSMGHAMVPWENSNNQACAKNRVRSFNQQRYWIS